MDLWIKSNLFTLLAGMLALGVINFLFCIVALFKVRRMKKVGELFFSGKNGKGLESVILSQAEELKNMDKEIQELFEISNKINNLALRSLHKVGVIRYNPFKDIGGDQSFAIALLDGKDCGVEISSLHTREGTRVYAKPVTKGESAKHPLAEEERQAIKVASPIKTGKI